MKQSVMTGNNYERNVSSKHLLVRRILERASNCIPFCLANLPISVIVTSMSALAGLATSMMRALSDSKGCSKYLANANNL